MKKSYLLFLSLYLVSCYTVYAQPDRTLHFEHLSVRNGLSQISVVSIFQDTYGFMWFGTRKGVNRYDGYSFKVFQESDSVNHISHDHITGMVEDKLGRMWVGTRDGINRYDRTYDRFIPYYHEPGNSSTLSNNNILSLLRDSRNELWVGTLSGLNQYHAETDSFSRFSDSGFPGNAPVHGMTEDQLGNIWIGTEDGLYRYNPFSKLLKKYNYQPGNDHSITQDHISTLFCDTKGRIWIGLHQSGICLYDEHEDYFIRYDKTDGLSNNNIRCIEEDRSGNILVGTFDGLCRYDSQTNRFHTAFSSEKGTVPMSNFSVYSTLCDRAGTVWIGTYSGGVNYYNPVSQRFRMYDPSVQKRYVFGIIGPMVEHPSGIWIGTEGGGLLHFDGAGEQFTYYQLPESSDNVYSRNIIKSLLLEGNTLWIGSARNTIFSFDIRQRKFVSSLSPGWKSNIHYALMKDRHNNLWVGSSGGQSIGYLTPGGESVFPAILRDGESFGISNVRCIVKDSPESFFIGSYSRGLFYYNEHTGEVKNWTHDKNVSNSLSYNRISSMCLTKDHELWISTFGGGISKYNRETDDFTSYDTRQGLASNTVYTILEDHDNQMWMTTSSGITMFDPSSDKFVNYSRNNGVEISEFTPGSGLVTSDNEIFFGGNDGIISFYGRDIRMNDYIPPVVITGISVNNESLPNYDTGESIRLSHQQSNITIEFSALNYIFPHQNQYAYKLEGFDKDWNQVGNRRVAYYTNIQPGIYTFRVKGSNNDGIWNEQGASLNIIIRRPPWNTWWAWLVYISVTSVVAFMIIRYARIKTHLENNIRLKQMEQENMEELHQTKIRLFTNFAHELRTPLTLILTPLEDMLQKNNLGQPVLDTMKMMFKNANRLLYTVNQLMDFRKKESGHLQIKASQGNIVKFTHEIVVTFNELAHARNISLEFISATEEQQVWYDRNLLEKVLFNILSNAFKNTPDQGTVTVQLTIRNISGIRKEYPAQDKQLPQADFVLLEFKDTGRGIPREELEKIFDPFYQVYHKESANLFGTGIGLNLSRGVIELHHGVIWAENNAGTPGATFRILLPLGREHLKDAELEPGFRNSEDVSHYIVPDQPVSISEDMITENPAYSVLIVEDNQDVRHYIKAYLRKYYTIYEADNGNAAFDLAVEHLPNLIVSDIMMPGMDGIQLCHLLKEDIRTGHIPVILLTARVTVMQIQEGFDTGADEYITKPFNAGILLTRIRNLIASRERLKELFGQKSSLMFPSLPTSSVDSRFMDSIYTYINDHLTDPDLNMDNFCREIGISRSGFYRKIKSISDLSPVELIRDTRLRYAAQYLKETSLSISEIAYQVGFSSPSYFTKTFKAFFNMSPTEMREQQKMEN